MLKLSPRRHHRRDAMLKLSFRWHHRPDAMLQRSIRRYQAADSLLQRRHAIATCPRSMVSERCDQRCHAIWRGFHGMAPRFRSAGTDQGDVTGVAMLRDADSMALRAIPFPRGLILPRSHECLPLLRLIPLACNAPGSGFGSSLEGILGGDEPERVSGQHDGGVHGRET